ncbi:DUF349 domain-containing protein [Paraglaciecola sp. L1A13]|uniref:DUF349 domain-containing protein n=1 Tax=Paraglaciecola sp. L1A13 TaxID=2686359 RepID=UPI00131CFF10|nr:DUF349 domain-containing protein [Paraglaciecola sp. L1A13]
MIFKKLFRPKYQDPKPQVRIAAIASLSADIPEQKSILHELAFNDEDVNVSLAALNKLNSFVLWYKMAEIAKNERIAKRAQQVVENTLFSDDDSVMGLEEKRAFVFECKNNKLLERLLKQTWVHREPELVLHILAVLNKPQLALPILLSSNDDTLQSALLVYADTESSLLKIIKKARSETIKKQAQDKLTKIQFSKTQHIEVEKGTRLVLSRLMALKDQRDYRKLVDIRAELDEQFSQFAAQFDCLSSDKRNEFNTKYTELSNKLAILDAELAPLYHAEQHKRELVISVKQVTADTQAVLVWLSDIISGDISAVTLAQTEQAQTEIQNRTVRIETLSKETKDAGLFSAQKELEALREALLKRQHTYNHLPAFQDALKQASALITDFTAQALPVKVSDIESAKPVLHQMKVQWRALREPYQDSWPKALDIQFSTLQRTWQDTLKSLSLGVTQDINRFRSKAKAVDSLIDQGKYKAAMGLFTKVSKWFYALPEAEQSRNARVFAQSSHKIEEIKSLQAYIALPRKPALLNEVKALITANISVSLRSAQVKDMRSRWSSLGVLNTPEDDAINAQFDVLIEQAFAPCREHFEKQQQKRVDNLAQKQTLLNDISALAEQDIADDAVVKKVQQIQQKWQAIGDVDFTLKTELNNEYRDALAPFKKRIESYFNDNAALKLTLIKQAQDLSKTDDILDAVEQAKTLQEKWKQIGPVQRKQENPLWNQFREANDLVFAQRKEHNQQQKSVHTEQVNIAQALLLDMQQSVKAGRTFSELDDAMVKQGEFESLLQSLPTVQSVSLRKRWLVLLDEREAKRVTLKQLAKQQSFDELFSILQRWESSEIPQDIETLPNHWQQSFKGQTESEVPRHKLTLMLELLCDVSSPESDETLRKEVQLQLMADKLQQGVEYDKSVLLKQWIQHGPVAQQEQILLQRTQRCFI